MKKRPPLTEKRIREIIQEELAKLPSYLPTFPQSAPPDPTTLIMVYYACSFVPVAGIPPPTFPPATITWTSTGSINVGKKP
jgi:hypothetical protein